jgi:bla regulator protein blaR1
MSISLWMANLFTYSVQLAVLLGVGLALPYLLRLGKPKWQQAYLKVLFLGVLLLPFAQPVVHEQRYVQRLNGRIRMSQEDFLAMQSVTRGQAPPPIQLHFQPSWEHLVLLLWAAGSAAQLIRMLLGLSLLRDYRNTAEDLPALNGIPIAVSDQIGSPATFGFWNPVILLPRSALALPQQQLDAILAHEAIHVERRDWLFSLAEELLLAVLWFHPAVWFLVEELRLNREKVVDAEARLRSGTEVYVEALVRMAASNLQPYFAAAPAFLRRRHLSSRIQSLLSEVSMSRSKLLAGYAVTSLLLLSSLVGIVWVKPLRGAPQIVEQPANIRVSGARLVFSKMPDYPMSARVRNVEGTVNVEVSIARNGEVIEARVLNGPQELGLAAIKSVVTWQFEPVETRATVSIDFKKPQEPEAVPGGRFARLDIESNISAPLAAAVRARLEVLVGQEVRESLVIEADNTTRSLSPKLRAYIAPKPDAAGKEWILMVRDNPQPPPPPPPPPTPGVNRIEVPAAQQAAKLLQSAPPVYPSLAAQARIQGIVRFLAVIGVDGTIKHMTVRNGHPLLVQAALETVKRYVYSPTYKEGKAVEVSTDIDVTFRLDGSQTK